MGESSKPGQMFGNLHAGHRSRDWSEFAADLVRSGRFHVPDVKLARSTVEKDEENGLRFAHSRLGAQQRRQHQPEQAQPAQLKPFAARRSAPYRMIRDMQHPNILLGWRLESRARVVNSGAR